LVIYLPCLYPAFAVLTIVADRPRWERRKESRPSKLRDAVLELLMECSFNATRLADVAQCEGVSKGTLYFYFGGKEELFNAVIRKGTVP
jgi:AcrR family transcriptional regulator